MWELDHKEGWMPKNWCFRTVVLEKTLQSPLDCQKIKPINPKGNRPWILIGRTDAKAEAPILRPPYPKSQLIGEDPNAGKDWGQEEKGTTGDEMIGWHHRFSGHEFEQTPGDSEGQKSLACCSPWGPKELDTTEQLNWDWQSKKKTLTKSENKEGIYSPNQALDKLNRFVIFRSWQADSEIYVEIQRT